MAQSPQTPDLQLINNGTGLNTSNLLNPNLNLVESYQNSQRSFYERTAGGSGWTEDQIADAAIRSRNLRPQKNMVQMTTNSFTVGATHKTSQQIQIVTAFPNAQVDLYVQQAYETNGPSGRWLIGAKLERSASPTFTTVQLLVGNQEEYYIPPPDGFAGHFKYLKFRIIDSVPTAGNWYYRLQLNVGQINGANTTGEPLSVIGAEKSGNNFDYSNYIIYEVTNGFTI